MGSNALKRMSVFLSWDRGGEIVQNVAWNVQVVMMYIKWVSIEVGAQALGEGFLQVHALLTSPTPGIVVMQSVQLGKIKGTQGSVSKALVNLSVIHQKNKGLPFCKLL